MTTVPQEAVKAAATALANYIGHGMTEKCVDKAKVALTAALPHLPGVGVKKLEWRDGYKDSQCTIIQADTLGGSYQLRQVDGLIWLDSIGKQTIYPTLDEAKAAAQADYAARILSALEPSNRPGTFDLDQIPADQLVNISRPESQRALESSAVRELALEEAARNLIAVRYDTYRARNGKLCSIEGDDGEKAWIVPFDAIAELESALSSPGHADAGKVEGEHLPQDVINLVIAAREVWEEADSLSYFHSDQEFTLRVKELDKALEAFSERVPYDDEPDALPSAPSQEVAGS